MKLTRIGLQRDLGSFVFRAYVTTRELVADGDRLMDLLAASLLDARRTLAEGDRVQWGASLLVASRVDGMLELNETNADETIVPNIDRTVRAWRAGGATRA